MKILKALKHRYCLGNMSCNLKTQILQFICTPKLLKQQQTADINLSIYASAKCSPIMFACLAVSETQCIICRPNFHNLEGNTKKFKKQLISNITKICLIYRLYLQNRNIEKKYLRVQANLSVDAKTLTLIIRFSTQINLI